MKQFPLFPRYFRWIALGLILLSIVLSFALKDHIGEYRVQAKAISINMFNLSLFIYFFTRRKIDDEMFVDMRLKGMAGGILYMIIGIFVTAIWDIVDPGEMQDKGAAGRILEGMIFVNFIFEAQYQKLKRSLDDE
ncbi:hypothetical protein H4K35_08800 [Myroides sp. NP-2]|uniref:hypothetical protein n=1 Tax=Myroides sp. NP-2 TaxID=2759945 RepID=UPI0015FAEDFD|nr:hypothetical protein [Myroides sp. NP-2]MBB1150227.1 hypothetical protein [Myroides sp. NP-2]